MCVINCLVQPGCERRARGKVRQNENEHGEMNKWIYFQRKEENAELGELFGLMFASEFGD